MFFCVNNASSCFQWVMSAVQMILILLKRFGQIPYLQITQGKTSCGDHLRKLTVKPEKKNMRVDKSSKMQPGKLQHRASDTGELARHTIITAANVPGSQPSCLQTQRESIQFFRSADKGRRLKEEVNWQANVLEAKWKAIRLTREKKKLSGKENMKIQTWSSLFFRSELLRKAEQENKEIVRWREKELVTLRLVPWLTGKTLNNNNKKDAIVLISIINTDIKVTMAIMTIVMINSVAAILLY